MKEQNDFDKKIAEAQQEMADTIKLTQAVNASNAERAASLNARSHALQYAVTWGSYNKTEASAPREVIDVASFFLAWLESEQTSH